MTKFISKDNLQAFWNGLKTKLGNKVDKVTGKGLSTNDYTTAEKDKLAGIAEGATKVIVDQALVEGSANAVSGDAVKQELDLAKSLSKIVSYTIMEGEAITWSLNQHEKEVYAALTDISSFSFKVDTSDISQDFIVYTADLYFTTGTTVGSITFTGITSWVGGVAPTFKASTTYHISVVFDYATQTCTGSYEPSIAVDSKLDATSVNPVQNATVLKALNNMVSKYVKQKDLISTSEQYIKIATVSNKEIAFVGAFLKLGISCRHLYREVMLNFNTSNLTTQKTDASVQVIFNYDKNHDHSTYPEQLLYYNIVASENKNVFTITLYMAGAINDSIATNVLGCSNLQNLDMDLTPVAVDSDSVEGILPCPNVMYDGPSKVLATPVDKSFYASFRALEAADLPDLSSVYQKTEEIEAVTPSASGHVSIVHFGTTITYVCMEKLTESNSITISGSQVTNLKRQCGTVTFLFKTGVTVPTVTYDSIAWANGSAPIYRANRVYEISVRAFIAGTNTTNYEVNNIATFAEY